MAIDRTILSSQEDPPDEADPSPTPPDEGERSWYAEAMGEEAATIPPDSGERSWYAEAMGEAPAKPVAPEPILSDPRMEMREGVDLQHPLDSQLFEELVSATPRLGAAYPALGMSPPTVRIGSGPLGVMDDDAISEFYHRSSEYQDPDSDSHIRGRAIGRMREIVGEARNAYLQEAGDNAPPEILARLNHAEMYARGQGFESARDMLEKGQAAAEASRLAKIIESGQPAPDGTIGNPFFDADLVYGRVYQPEEDVDPIPGEEIVRDWERGFRTLTRATEKVDAPQDPSLAGGLDPAQYGWEGEKGEFLKVLRDAAKAGPDSEDISEYVSNFPIGPTLDGVHDSEMLRNEIRYIEMLKHTMKRINERRVDGELTEDDANWLKSQVSRAMAIVSGRDGALSPLSSRQAAVKRVQTLVGPQHPMALEAAEKLLQSAPPPDGASADAARIAVMLAKNASGSAWHKSDVSQYLAEGGDPKRISAYDLPRGYPAEWKSVAGGNVDDALLRYIDNPESVTALASDEIYDPRNPENLISALEHVRKQKDLALQHRKDYQDERNMFSEWGDAARLGVPREGLAMGQLTNLYALERAILQIMEDGIEDRPDAVAATPDVILADLVNAKAAEMNYLMGAPRFRSADERKRSAQAKIEGLEREVERSAREYIDVMEKHEGDAPSILEITGAFLGLGTAAVNKENAQIDARNEEVYFDGTLPQRFKGRRGYGMGDEGGIMRSGVTQAQAWANAPLDYSSEILETAGEHMVMEAAMIYRGLIFGGEVAIMGTGRDRENWDIEDWASDTGDAIANAVAIGGPAVGDGLAHWFTSMFEDPALWAKQNPLDWALVPLAATNAIRLAGGGAQLARNTVRMRSGAKFRKTFDAFEEAMVSKNPAAIKEELGRGLNAAEKADVDRLVDTALKNGERHALWEVFDIRHEGVIDKALKGVEQFESKFLHRMNAAGATAYAVSKGWGAFKQAFPAGAMSIAEIFTEPSQLARIEIEIGGEKMMFTDFIAKSNSDLAIQIRKDLDLAMGGDIVLTAEQGRRAFHVLGQYADEVPDVKAFLRLPEDMAAQLNGARPRDFVADDVGVKTPNTQADKGQTPRIPPPGTPDHVVKLSKVQNRIDGLEAERAALAGELDRLLEGKPKRSAVDAAKKAIKSNRDKLKRARQQHKTLSERNPEVSPEDIARVDEESAQVAADLNTAQATGGDGPRNVAARWEQGENITVIPMRDVSRANLRALNARNAKTHKRLLDEAEGYKAKGEQSLYRARMRESASHKPMTVKQMKEAEIYNLSPSEKAYLDAVAEAVPSIRIKDAVAVYAKTPDSPGWAPNGGQVEHIIQLKDELSYASRIRQEALDLGSDLVRMGILDEATWLKNLDNYIPELYDFYEKAIGGVSESLDNFLNTFTGKKMAAPISRMMKRKLRDLSLAEKRKIAGGIIENAPYSAARMITEMRTLKFHMEMLRALDEAGEAMGPTTNPIWRKPDTGVEIPKGWKKLPTKVETKMGFGPQTRAVFAELGGRYVAPGVYSLLMNQSMLPGHTATTLSRYYTKWKAFKTIGNIAGHLRNTMSNVIMADWAGLRPWDPTIRSARWGDLNASFNAAKNEYSVGEMRSMRLERAKLEKGLRGMDPSKRKAAEARIKTLGKNIEAGKLYEEFLAAGGAPSDFISGELGVKLRKAIKNFEYKPGEKSPVPFVDWAHQLVDHLATSPEGLELFGRHQMAWGAGLGATIGGSFGAGAAVAGGALGAAYMAPKVWSILTKLWGLEEKVPQLARFKQVRRLQQEFRKTGRLTPEMKEVLGRGGRRIGTEKMSQKQRALYYLNVDESLAPIRARQEAEKWFFNYKDVPPIVEMLRSNWAPFITYQYKAFPRSFEFMLENPMRATLYRRFFETFNTLSESLDGTPPDDFTAEMRAVQKLTIPTWGRQAAFPLGASTTYEMMEHGEPTGESEEMRQFVSPQYMTPLGGLVKPGGEIVHSIMRKVWAPLQYTHPLGTSLSTLLTGEGYAGPVHPQSAGTGIWGMLGNFKNHPGLIQYLSLNLGPEGFRKMNKLMSVLSGTPDYRGRMRTVNEMVSDTVLGTKFLPVEEDAEEALERSLSIHIASAEKDARRLGHKKQWPDEWVEESLARNLAQIQLQFARSYENAINQAKMRGAIGGHAGRFLDNPPVMTTKEARELVEDAPGLGPETLLPGLLDWRGGIAPDPTDQEFLDEDWVDQE